jgi:hypothetical protein
MKTLKDRLGLDEDKAFEVLLVMEAYSWTNGRWKSFLPQRKRNFARASLGR